MGESGGSCEKNKWEKMRTKAERVQAARTALVSAAPVDRGGGGGGGRSEDGEMGKLFPRSQPKIKTHPKTTNLTAIV